ncbi:MAG: bifunctional 4-hydroxy-2-oxoglutarate aldolase/2-dehydro-3-deoxy-phosphogluconate aldolase [Planctomycetaceae bacterium]|jgi:2-dehydro-3-deoxyphosphogluconate aldolase/(4S)-4-hydroxy-2-oxoglutarate aldolase|nr:bifunctional 4-hydroxy-2-oxoglutarate aldolase/2-dehydro-3-deoxy-phosphogluconate aldolase [Planctomycetaceae bacterium]
MNFNQTLQDQLFQAGVIACMTIENPDHAVFAAKALLDGGIKAIELTLRTPQSIESLHRITAEVPEILAGAGTILFPDQVKAVVEAGGMFGVAPGLSERVVKTAQDYNLPFAPGVMTASEVEKGLELDCTVMKLFPAESAGGLEYMKSLWKPYAHLGVRFIPLGGLSSQNMADYLREPSTLAIGGSWLVTRESLSTNNRQTITSTAREASTIAANVRRNRN